jgi:hypothetical protein
MGGLYSHPRPEVRGLPVPSSPLLQVKPLSWCLNDLSQRSSFKRLRLVNGGLEMPNYGGIKVLMYISTYLILS